MVPPSISVSRVSRWGRTFAYLAIGLSGTFILFLDIFGTYYKTMGLWCLVGGVCCALGSASGRWAGEYTGLPLIGSAMFAFAVLTYRDTWEVAQWVSVPSILLLAAYGVLLTARWIDVAAVRRAARGYADATR